MVEAKKMMVETTERSTADEEPLSPAARIFQAPRLSCYIISIMGSKTAIKPDIIIQGLNQTLIKHPRFSSKLGYDKGGKPRWVPTEIKLEDHVIVPDLDPDMEKPEEFIEDYVSNMSAAQLDVSKPLWQLHILNVKTPEADAVGVFKIHHSIGDGMSLMSLVLACTRKTSDPESIASLPVQKQRDNSKIHSRNGILRLFLALWFLLARISNSLVDILLFTATALFLRDTETPLKSSSSTVEHTRKRFVHRTVCLNDIKDVKDATKMTINDVILGVTQAGLSRYLNRKYGSVSRGNKEQHQDANNLPKAIRFRSAILVNLRPTTGMQDLADMMAKHSKCRWGNQIGYILLPFSIGQRDDPLDYLWQAKAAMDRKKLSFEAILTHISAKLMSKMFGTNATAGLVHRVLSNTTVSFSNMVGPVEEIGFYGHPITYIAPSVYGHPHALTVHFQSYVEKMTISLAVDPTVIPDAHQLCLDLEESLNSFKIAVLERGLLKSTVD